MAGASRTTSPTLSGRTRRIRSEPASTSGRIGPVPGAATSAEEAERLLSGPRDPAIGNDASMEPRVERRPAVHLGSAEEDHARGSEGVGEVGGAGVVGDDERGASDDRGK